ncbi:MAG: CBS domain-containing protein [Pseudomonadales bacterium]|nr:CBS domain-containing protein [Pseudomonadales bacterium]
MNVDKVMTRQVQSISPSQVVADIHLIFRNAAYHHLPVLDEGRLVGIISDRDLSRCLSPFLDTSNERPEDRAQLNIAVRDIMSTDIVTVDSTTSVETASILLLENRISCLPVVTHDLQLEGLLTWKDILRYHVYFDEAAQDGNATNNSEEEE